jgi:hypothetical protein
MTPPPTDHGGHPPRGPDPANDTARGLADLIRRLGALRRAGARVTLGDALDQAGARMHGAAILLLALPDALPLPIPSFAAILGVPLLAISLHLAIFGERGDLPRRVRAVPLPPRLIDLLERHLSGWLARAERLSVARLSALASRERLIGFACSVMSVLLLLPVPLMNVPPALALVCLSWGLLQRDGLIVALGLSMAAGVGVLVLALVQLMSATLGGVLG